VAEIEFAGERFQLAGKVGLMPLMKFAHVASRGVDTDDMEGLAAMYDLLQSVIADEEWARFERKAIESRADGDELFGTVKAAISALTARPTEGPSDSSDGPQTESTSSLDDSSSRVVRRMEMIGRPSLAVAVLQASEDRERVSAASA
jgi:hypothetical protein